MTVKRCTFTWLFDKVDCLILNAVNATSGEQTLSGFDLDGIVSAWIRALKNAKVYLAVSYYPCDSSLSWPYRNTCEQNTW